MKKRTQAEKQQLVRQIICLAMVILMLLGVLVAAIPYVSAAEVTENSTSDVVTEVMTEDAENEEEPDEGLLLRIGLMYGTGVTQSFAVRASDGFVLGHTGEDDVFTPYIETAEPYIAVCRDDNLALDDDGYYVPASSGVVIGGYHLELPTAYNTKEAITEAVEKTNTALKNAGIHSSLIYAFPAYKAGNLYVRIGDFGSGDSAAAKADTVAAVTGETPTVVYPMSDAMTVIAPDKNLILFEYRAGDGLLGVSPLPDDDAAENEVPEENVIVTPAKNGYQGVFLFGRYNDGISVTNLIPLEQYVAGVLPYEINNNWSYESLKTFACIIRSYTLANRSKHSSYKIDLCNGTDCQVYRGTGQQNDAVLRAVDETRGMVITYDDKVCNTFYSAVTGGCTVNIEQIWNGSAFPYLRAVETPWEDYASHPNGIWMSEVSPYDLYVYLSQTKGYTKLKGSIADVAITELAENSSYVYKLTVTDVYGNTVTLKGTDIIRTTLGRYLSSANFVVGYKGEIPILDRFLSVLTPDGIKALTLTESANKTTTRVLTADGVKEFDISDGMEVIRADGSSTLFTNEDAVYDIPADALERLTDETNENFLFIGKGWGHGGGISQWGAKNMAENGAFYDEIIHAYFTDVEIKDYRTLPAFAGDTDEEA
ncbi:MAG: SpoIID/LytB domain-containing protein [Clostridia bacterium]|nr:SpoIID/LytB domain-containing protein [Clostridia bacterium]